MKIKKFSYIILTLLLLILPACFKGKKKIVDYENIECVDKIETLQDKKNMIESNNEEQNKEESNLENEDIKEYELVEDENPISEDNLDELKNSYENLNKNTKDELKEKYKDIDQENQSHNFKTIFYDFNKYNLKDSQKPDIEYNCKVAKDLADKGYDIVIEGHSCNITSSTSYNIMLSEERAKSLAKELKKHGIDEKNIKVIGRGAEMPIVESGNIEQQAPNRRAEIYAYKK